MSVEDNVYRIRHATYGEEVREAIADSIESMNVKVEATEEARQDAIDAAEQAEEYRDETQQIVDDAIDDIYERVVEDVGSALDVLYLTKSASGAIIEFSDGADDIPLKSLTVNITPIQSGSGDPSPVNQRPIGGWTGACIATSQGKNLIGGADMAASMKRHVPSTTINADNVATFKTTADRDDYIYFVQLPYKENTQYTFILTVSRTVIPSNSNTVYRLYYTDGSYENIGLPDDREANTKYTRVRTSAPDKTVAYLSKVSTSGYISIYCNESGVFEGVLTAADFVPYVGKTIAVTWQTEAGTVYGGTLTYSGNGTWTLTATHAIYALDASGWIYVPSHGYFRTNLPANAIEPQPTSAAGWCSCYPVLTVQSNDTFYNQDKVLIYCKSGISGVKRVFIRDTDYDADTLHQFFASLAGQTLVYQLDTPQIYTLTADDVLSLLGENNVWADCGNIAELTYRVDPNIHEAETQSEISNLTAEISDLTAEISDLTAKTLNAYPTETSSGAIASTSIGADDIPLESLAVQVVSSQDLHGFDAPWIAGGGGNLWNSAENPLEQGAISSSDGMNASSTSRVRCANYVAVEPNTTYTIAAGGGDDVYLYYYADNGTYLSAKNWSSLPYTFVVPENATKLRIVVRYSDNSVIQPNDVVWLTVAKGENAIPYENICPISGWTGANVYVNQLNLFDGVYQAASISSTGEKYVFRTDLAGRTAVLPIKGGFKYLVKKFDESPRMTICWCDHYPQSNDELTLIFVGPTITTKLISVPVGARYLIIFVSTSTGQEEPRMVVKFGTETISEFIPYVGRTIAVTWPTEVGTVYGGTLTYSGGAWTLTVTHNITTIGALSWEALSAPHVFRSSNIATPSDGINFDPTVPIMCDSYVSVANTVTTSEMGNLTIKRGAASIDTRRRIYVRDDEFEDADAFAQARASVTVAFPVRTQTSVSLTADEVNSLLGETNVWADTGDVTATFRCDPTLYINSKIQALTALMSEL